MRVLITGGCFLGYHLGKFCCGYVTLADNKSRDQFDLDLRPC